MASSSETRRPRRRAGSLEAWLAIAALGCSGEQTERSSQRRADCRLARDTSSVEATALNAVSSLDVDSNGRVYVLDGQRTRPRLLAFEDDLQHWTVLARAGDGPGELNDAQNVDVFSGDSVLVYDRAANRISVFPPRDGPLAYDINLSTTAPTLAWPRRVHPFAADQFIAVAHKLVGTPADIREPRSAIVSVLAADGSLVRDSLLVLPQPTEFIIGYVGRLVFSIVNPAGRLGLVRIGPDGDIYYGLGDALEVDVFSSNGSRVRHISAAHDPIPFTEADLDSLLAQQHGLFASSMVQKQIREQAPNTWPAFRQFLVDDRANLWIGALTPRGLPTEWLVFDAMGRLRCSLALPEQTELHAIRWPHVYAVETNSTTDVPRIVRLLFRETPR